MLVVLVVVCVGIVVVGAGGWPDGVGLVSLGSSHIKSVVVIGGIRTMVVPLTTVVVRPEPVAVGTCNQVLEIQMWLDVTAYVVPSNEATGG